MNHLELDVERIGRDIRRYKEDGLSLFSTSSLQTQSIVLLHIISRTDKTLPVYFMNTGYHFPETLEYKDEIAERFGLNILELSSAVPKSRQRTDEGELLFASDPDFCCRLNKTEPLEPILRKYDVWINGVRKAQSSVRQQMQKEGRGKFGIRRYHPMLEWTAKDIFDYIREYNLPKHPLMAKGFLTVGCKPCTQRNSGGLDDRSGRWKGMKKTECGLHTTLVS